MKRLSLLTLFLLCPFALADVTGTWAYSGSGCRNQALDASNHRSKAPSNAEDIVLSAIFTFSASGTVQMNASLNDGTIQNETSDYTLDGNSLTINEWSNVTITVQDDRIIIVDSEETACNSGESFVHIMAPVE